MQVLLNALKYMWFLVFLEEMPYFFLLLVATPVGIAPCEPQIQLQTVRVSSVS